MSRFRDLVAAHRKVLIATATAIAVKVLGPDWAEIASGVIGLGLTYWIPNDPAAAERVYNTGVVPPELTEDRPPPPRGETDDPDRTDQPRTRRDRRL